MLAVGGEGGLVRANTGYGFARMRRDADVIASSLETVDHPFDGLATPRRHPWLDAVLLELMQRDPAAVADAFDLNRVPIICNSMVSDDFDQLFVMNPTARVLRFLDGRTSPWEDARLVRTLPVGPFLGAARSLRWNS